MKRFLTLTAMLAVVASLAACGGNKPAEGGSADASNTEAATEATTEAATEAATEAPATDASGAEGGEETAEVDTEAILDSWTLNGIVDADGNAYTFEEYCEANGVDAEGTKMVMTFNEDGTYEAAIGGISADEGNGTYEFDGTTVNAETNAGAPMTLIYIADEDLLALESEEAGTVSLFTRGEEGLTVEDYAEAAMADALAGVEEGAEEGGEEAVEEGAEEGGNEAAETVASTFVGQDSGFTYVSENDGETVAITVYDADGQEVANLTGTEAVDETTMGYVDQNGDSFVLTVNDDGTANLEGENGSTDLLVPSEG